MTLPKIVCFVGTRPEVIKMAPVIWELRRRPHAFTTEVVATAQHRDMLDEMLALFALAPDVDLNLMEPNQTPVALAARTLTAVDAVLRSRRPDLVLVQGDTTTAMAVSLAAFLGRIPVGHVEAGLRSFDKRQPFPEEVNRRTISIVADWHFAPTERARRHLLVEGVPESAIVVTGNTVIDALFAMVDRTLPLEPAALNRIDFTGRRVILVTAHRRESHGRPLRSVCGALRVLVERHPHVEIVFPVHPNPNVRSTVEPALGGHPRIHLVPPVSYRTIINLMDRCFLILTDSGGIQEEAPSLRKPVLVLREVTERPEAAEAGLARLVGTDPDAIVRETERLLSDPAHYVAMTRGDNPYGDGKAAWRIAEVLERRSGVGFTTPASAL